MDVGSISAIIVDDENHSVQTLRYELQRHCQEVTILSCCQSGLEAIEAVGLHKPDLVFLDIEMPGMNGFEVLQRLMPVDFEVIFVTAYDQYAIQAFRFAAADYLLKPVIAQDLVEAVNRVRQKKERNPNQQLKTLLHNMQEENRHAPRIALPHGNAFEYVPVHDIVRCQADSNYCHIFMREGTKYFIAKTLREVEEWLAPYGFFRCHQSHMINLDQVKRYVKSDGGYLVMIDGSQVPVSRRKVDQFNEMMKR